MRFFRSAAIPLALASLLGSLRPAAAVDLTNYTPFVANIACPVVFQNGAATTCQGAANLPTNRKIVLEYISFSCTGIPPAVGRLFAANVETQVGGVTNVQFLELPVAASLGLAAATSGGQVVRLYADPASSIGVTANINGSSSSFGCTFHLSGQQSPPLLP